MNAHNKKLKTGYLQALLTLFLTVFVVLVFYWGSQFALGTSVPYMTVSTDSMHISNGDTGSWVNPFEPTLQVGDLLIIQGIDPKNLRADYPNSDIIVFHEPVNSDKMAVNRIAAKAEVDGKLYFSTKGDGVTQYKWPNPVNPAYYDQWPNGSDHILQSAISQDLVVGKVAMRIPLVGYFPLCLQGVFSGMELGDSYIMVLFAAVLVVLLLLRFRLLSLRHKRSIVEHNALTRELQVYL